MLVLNTGKTTHHAETLPMFLELGNFIFHNFYINVLRQTFLSLCI